MNSTSLASSEGVTMISLDSDGKMVIISSIKQEPDDFSEVPEGGIELADPEISKVNREESLDTFLETSESDSSTEFINHVKQEPELSIVSKLPPVAEHEEEFRKRLSVNLRKFDTKWIKKSRLFETFFKCPKCQVLTKNSNAERHLMGCRGQILPEIYHCYRCQESFNLRQHWEIHMGKKHRRKMHQKDCKDCGENFKTRSLLANHRKIMGEHKNLLAKNHTLNQKTSTCNGCGKKFKSMEKFLKHRKLKKCVYCDKKFQCLYTRMQHFREVHGQDLKCPKCFYVGKNLNGLKRHAFFHSVETFEETSKNTLHFTLVNNQYICDKCGIKYKEKANILRHQNRMRNYKCIVCDQEFECRYAKNKHMSGVHGQDFKCPKCSFIGTNLEKLRVHVYGVHNTLKRKFGNEFICKFCRKIFPTKYKLSKHLRSCPQNFECDICGEEFLIKNDLRQHMFDTHVNKRLQKESTEHHSITASEALRCHDYCRETRWIQSGNYQCYQCKETFDSRKLLNCHNAKHHPIACSYCGEQFKYKYSLYKHQSIRNCNCIICDEKFKCRGGLDKHYRSAHANKLCPKCPFVGKTITELKMHCLGSHQTHVNFPKVSNGEFQSDFDNADSNENTEKLNTSFRFSDSTAIPETKTSRLDCNVLNVEQESNHFSEVIDGESDLTNPEIEEALETSESESSADHVSHVKREPELSIVSKLPPVAEHEEELRKQLTVNLQNLDAMVENSAEKHVVTCRGPISPTIYQCYRCQESFNLREDWQDHLRKHKPASKLQCDCCGQKFRWINGLESHQNSMGNYKCAICDLEFRCKYAKINHFRDVHGQDFKCPKCSFVAGNLRALISHSHIHRNKIERYTCDKCGKDFGTQCLLLRHMNLIGLYECSMCEKTFEFSYARDQHFQDIHGQDLLTSRRNHIRIAKENFPKEIPGIAHPFGCGYCGEHFKDKYKFMEHQSFLNSFICNKKFECHGALDKHKSVHQSEKTEASFVLKLPADEKSLETETFVTRDRMNNVKQEPEVSYVVKLPSADKAFQNIETQPIRKSYTFRFNSDRSIPIPHTDSHNQTTANEYISSRSKTLSDLIKEKSRLRIQK